MVERSSDYVSSRFIFELTIHKLSLSVDRGIDVDLLWVAGNQRSQTGERINILPNTFSHKVNQKLIIHHTFNDDGIIPFKSTLKVLESQRYVEPTVLGKCDIDLASLIFEKHTRAVTVPLETKLDDNACLSFSAKVTNLVLGDESVVSSSMSSVSERLAEYQNLMPLTSIGNSTKTHVLHGMNSDDMYRSINKMATKLSHIEREIQSKTLKLNKINRNNLDEINGIRSRLEYQISQKDKQIQILSIQLDEMHTALALSHQRELELGGYNLTSIHAYNNTNPLDDHDGLGYAAGCGSDFDRHKSHMKSSISKSYLGPSFMSQKSATEFGNRGMTNDYESHHHNHNRSRSNVVDNLATHSMDNRSKGHGCVVHRKLPTTSAIVKARLLNGSLAHSNNEITRKGSPKAASPLNDYFGHSHIPGIPPSKGRDLSRGLHVGPRKSTFPVPNKPHHVPPTMVSDNMISVGEYPFAGSLEGSRLYNAPSRADGIRTAPKYLPHDGHRDVRPLTMSSGNQLRTPATTTLHTTKSPQLTQRVHKAQSHMAFNKGPHHLMSRAGAFGDVAGVAMDRKPRLNKSPSSVHSTYDHNAEIRIVSLERDLITTKVALANSETQRDIDITHLLRQATKQ